MLLAFLLAPFTMGLYHRRFLFSQFIYSHSETHNQTFLGFSYSLVGFAGQNLRRQAAQPGGQATGGKSLGKLHWSGLANVPIAFAYVSLFPCILLFIMLFFVC